MTKLMIYMYSIITLHRNKTSKNCEKTQGIKKIKIQNLGGRRVGPQPGSSEIKGCTADTKFYTTNKSILKPDAAKKSKRTSRDTVGLYSVPCKSSHKRRPTQQDSESASVSNVPHNRVKLGRERAGRRHRRETSRLYNIPGEKRPG